ncbi:hypothetical protein [Niallia sp. NCCP-28]|uniref:hypothetical protein n=1 Tax=Niallia sp. NCCP-28 TaxID=2934712 RepID=UPI002085DCF4|nr:hypothetical protein [Niallia sp. NCCP-28]GKU85314.1 hypothetical protein NCCP28_47100 [Niallia sp. NCCP-28]
MMGWWGQHIVKLESEHKIKLLARLIENLKVNEVVPLLGKATLITFFGFATFRIFGCGGSGKESGSQRFQVKDTFEFSIVSRTNCCFF